MKKGISASKGYAFGTVLIKRNKNEFSMKKNISNVVEEKKRFYEAIKNAKNQLINMKDKAEKQGDTAKIEGIEIELELLKDSELIGAVESNIETNIVSSDKAMKEVIDLYVSIFECMEDHYTKKKCFHIRGLASRIVSNLVGNAAQGTEILEQDTVVVAEDLVPLDAVQFDKDRVVAFLTNAGAKTSHVAIMAKALGIPAIVGLNNITTLVKNGDKVIVDGIEGKVIINPDQNTIEKYIIKKMKQEQELEDLKLLKNTRIVDKRGKYINIEANIASYSEVDQVLKNGADGIGLFRTEYLYMDSEDLPTEEEQFQSYKYVLEKMGNKSVIIRTLDIGVDKKPEYIYVKEEQNPFLGNRGIRFCLDRKDIFTTQLKALLRASVYGNLKIMFPMVATVEEFLNAKEILNQCMEELRVDQIAYDENIQVGIMIEVPAAAICADELAKYADFFSIGTNDLIQYTFASDRMNEKVSYLYNTTHPAILRLVKIVIDAAHNENKICGMCGEMASDEKAVKILLNYGLDCFSMTPTSILNTKKFIKEL